MSYLSRENRDGNVWMQFKLIIRYFCCVQYWWCCYF